MKSRVFRTLTLTSFLLATAGYGADNGASNFESALLELQHEWAHANYEVTQKKERRQAFEMLVEHSNALAERYPSEVGAVAWDGIVLSTYAGEVSAFGAMKVAKQALARLEQAEAMDGDALAGGVYASLGALYSKVPGGFVGFGDDDVARDYFERALTVDEGNIDNNYFYGEFLIKQGDYALALERLNRALASAPTAERPVFDSGRRAEIRQLIELASERVSSGRVASNR